MTTPIDTFEDILAALERNPALRDAMRYHVLGEELMRLPETVARLAETVAELAQTVRELQATVAAMAERQDRMEADITEIRAGQTRMEARQTRMEARQDRMEARQDRMEADITEIKAGQTRMEARQNRVEADITEIKAGQNRMERRQNRMDGTLNRLIGGDYERKAARRASRLARRHLNLPDATVVYAITTSDNDTIPNLIDQAVAQGRITDAQANELENADIILADAGAAAYAVIEVSITMDEHDVMRARNWADILAQASNAATRAACISVQALDSGRLLAAENRVAVIIMPD